MESYFFTIFFIFGLIIGSFLNVIISRLPKKLSIITPRSYCPNCKKPIAAWQNIPLISFLVLRGRCANCHEPISWRYPIVELLTGLWFLLLFIQSQEPPQIALGLFFGSSLIALAFIDLENGILPDKITLPSAILIIILRAFIEPAALWKYLVFGLGAAVFLLLLNAISLAIFGKEGIFGGDIKISAYIGFALGANVIPAMFLGFISGALAGVLIMTRRKSIKDAGYMPFGPYLAFGAMAAYLWGPRLIDWYLGSILGT